MDERDRQIEQLTAMVKTLKGTKIELQEIIRDLHRQLNQNSHNSSKLPSSDGDNKPSTKS